MYRTLSAVLNSSNLAHNELSDTKTITQPLLGNSFKERGGNGTGPVSGSMRAGVAASFFIFFFLCLPGNCRVANGISVLSMQALGWDVRIWRCDTAVFILLMTEGSRTTSPTILDAEKVHHFQTKVHWKVTPLPPTSTASTLRFPNRTSLHYQLSRVSWQQLHPLWESEKNASNWFYVSNDCCIDRCVKLT